MLSSETKSGLKALGIISGLSVLAFVIGVVRINSSGTGSNSAMIARATSPVEAPQRRPQDLWLETGMQQSSIAGAFAAFKPKMRDTVNEMDGGSALFGIWASTRMQWADLMSVPSTSFARVKKDSELERGGRLCLAGTISQIQRDTTVKTPMYVGLIIGESGNVASFLSAGSTASLVEDTWAKFCGVATGIFSFSNAAGGTTHAVRLVGMFDLPENKRQTAAQSTGRRTASQ